METVVTQAESTNALQKRKIELGPQVRQVAAIYQGGVLKPLQSLGYAENTRVYLDIFPAPRPPEIAPPQTELAARREWEKVHQLFLQKGWVTPPAEEPVPPVSARERARLACVLAKGGPLSELVIAEREGR